jgi:hypothetical protein
MLLLWEATVANAAIVETVATFDAVATAARCCCCCGYCICCCHCVCMAIVPTVATMYSYCGFLLWLMYGLFRLLYHSAVANISAVATIRCCCLAVLLLVGVRTNTEEGHVEGQCVNRT